MQEKNKNKIKDFIKTYAKKILGVLLILTGIIGLFLPFLQGILMIAAGVLLLGNKHLITKMRQFWQFLKKLTDRYFKKNNKK